MKVLLVDDEPTIARGIAATISNMKIEFIREVRFAVSPAEAMKVAEEFGPDVVITDIVMPGATGLELIQRLRRAFTPLAQYIVVSGHDDYQLLRGAMLLDTVDYLLKPVRSADLRQALERAHARNEAERVRGQEYLQSRRDLRRSFLLELLSLEANDEQLPDEALTSMRETLAAHAPIPGLFAVVLEAAGGAEDLLTRSTAGTGSIFVSFQPVPCVVVAVVSATVESSPAALAQVRANLERAAAESASRMPEDRRVAVSSVGGDVLLIHRLYREAQNARLSGIVSGSRFAQWDSPQFRQTGRSWTREVFDLSDLVRRSDTPRARQAIDSMIRAIRSSNSPVADLVTLVEAVERALEIPPGGKHYLRAARSLDQFGEVLAELALQQEDERARIGESRSLEQRMRHFVLQRLGSEFDMRDAAQSVNLSYNYFSSLFKTSVGEPFSRFVLKVRLEEGRRLLKSAPLGIEEIAYRVGFRSPKHFSRAFRDSFGMTPSEARASDSADPSRS